MAITNPNPKPIPNLILGSLNLTRGYGGPTPSVPRVERIALDGIGN